MIWCELKSNVQFVHRWMDVIFLWQTSVDTTTFSSITLTLSKRWFPCLVWVWCCRSTPIYVSYVKFLPKMYLKVYTKKIHSIFKHKRQSKSVCQNIVNSWSWNLTDSVCFLSMRCAFHWLCYFLSFHFISFNADFV